MEARWTNWFVLLLVDYVDYTETVLGIPHACSSDDIYKGYFIPKGAIVIGNTWLVWKLTFLFSSLTPALQGHSS